MPDVGADVWGLVDRAVDPVGRLASDAGGSGLGGWRRVLRTNRNWSGVGRNAGSGMVRLLALRRLLVFRISSGVCLVGLGMVWGLDGLGWSC